MNKLKIGNVELESNAVLAPIAGYSDVGFRAICAKMDAGMTYTEMISAKGLVYRGENTRELLNTTPYEKKKAVQIFGSEPEFIEKAVRDEALQKFDVIDINMGCPMPKIVNNGEGSALLENPHLAQKVVKAALTAGKPVTVKFRLGVKLNDYIAVDFAKYMQDAGAYAVTVHGRTREQMYSGDANWEEIAKVKEAIEIPVIANGDVFSKADYEKILEVTKADGVMLARGALGNPTIFREILGKSVDNISMKDLIFEHLDIMQKFHNERYIINNFKKHMTYYMKGIIGARDAKMEAYEAKNIVELKSVINKYFH